MSMNRRTGLRLGAGAGGLALAGLLWAAYGALPILTGYTAKLLASGVFVARRSIDAIMADDVDPLASGLDWDFDREANAVTVSFHGFAPRTAVYHEGLGVTLLPPGREHVSFTPDFARTPEPERNSGATWPAGDVTSHTELDADVRRKLETAIDWAFTDRDPDRPRRTRAVVVVRGGQLVAERYGESGIGVNSPLLGWSMSKSVVNALVGIMVREGRLGVAQSAPVAEWQGASDPRAAITLEMLLRMSSGLEFNEDYGNPYGDVLPMLFKSPDFGAYAAAKPLAAAPGTRWSYSSGTTNLICRILREQVGNDPDYFNFPRVELFDKIGMTSAVMEPDPSGNFVGSSYTYATARDWARFGLFYLQDGVWNGERILPEGWVAYSTTPAPNAPQGRYGAHWWLNAGEPGNPANRWMPSLPPDTYLASGHEGQFVVVVPSRDTVIVRLGVTRGRQFDLETFVRQILDALPAGDAG